MCQGRFTEYLISEAHFKEKVGFCQVEKGWRMDIGLSSKRNPLFKKGMAKLCFIKMILWHYGGLRKTSGRGFRNCLQVFSMR